MKRRGRTASTPIRIMAVAVAGALGCIALGSLFGGEVERGPEERGSGLAWRLNTPHPWVVPEARANPAAVADKLAARAASMDRRAALRAFEGAPPVIPHSILDMNVQTCRACHAEGLVTGDKVARMVSHTYLPNCTQCHVEAEGFLLDPSAIPANGFDGWRSAGLGGTRAAAGAPPVVPHTFFMRTNCVSCHGEFGYDGWRPDHLSRSSCAQCHAPAAQLDQLSPAPGASDAPTPFRSLKPE